LLRKLGSCAWLGWLAENSSPKEKLKTRRRAPEGCAHPLISISKNQLGHALGALSADPPCFDPNVVIHLEAPLHGADRVIPERSDSPDKTTAKGVVAWIMNER